MTALETCSPWTVMMFTPTLHELNIFWIHLSSIYITLNPAKYTPSNKHHLNSTCRPISTANVSASRYWVKRRHRLVFSAAVWAISSSRLPRKGARPVGGMAPHVYRLFKSILRHSKYFRLMNACRCSLLMSLFLTKGAYFEIATPVSLERKPAV